MSSPADRARARVSGDQELADELERLEAELARRRLRAPYARDAIEYLAVTLFAGVVLAILGVAAAIVAWAWGVNG